MAKAISDRQYIQRLLQKEMSVSQTKGDKTSKQPWGSKRKKRESGVATELLVTKFSEILRQLGFDCRVIAQKIDDAGRSVGRPESFVSNQVTLALDLYEQMGKGRYKLLVASRNPYEAKWHWIRIDKLEVGGSSDCSRESK